MTDWPLSGRLRKYLEVQFELRRVLGIGGMGAVILANERALDRLVAIKVLHGDKSGDAESRERFRREARAAARLTHPNIVPLLTFGEVDGELYYVMGYVEGETLASRLERVGRIAPDEARARLTEIADALAYAHAAGIVHRDLKPENILIETASGRAVLTDFGIARDVLRDPSLTSTGVIVGTPHYMSPEQASGERVIDGRSDLYSLGVIGYRMLSGTLPFGGANAREVLMQHLTASAAPLPAAIAQASPALDAAVRRALAKSPEDRHRSAAEFAAALRHDTDDDVLPEELESRDGLYARVVLLGVAVGALMPLVKIAGLSDGSMTGHLLAGGAEVLGVVSVGAIVHLVERARDAATAARQLVVGLRPPRWWFAWWPRPYRRPGDVWERLGWELRWDRNVDFGFFVVTLPLSVAGLIWYATGENSVQLALAIREHNVLSSAIIYGALAVGVGLIVLNAALSYRWLRRRGFALKDWAGMAMLPNADPRWKLPRYARLLEDGAAIDASAGSLDALIAGLRGAGVLLPDGLTGALQAVRRAEEGVDRQLGGLREMVNAEETVRLDRRIAMIGHGDPQLRALLESQRALLARAEGRIGELGALRERLAAQQQVLRQQLVALRDLAPSGGDLSEITGRIRAVNDDLRRLSEGLSGI